jgi:hypothetical protein
MIVRYDIVRFWICTLIVPCMIFLKIGTVRHTMVQNLDTTQYDTHETKIPHDTTRDHNFIILTLSQEYVPNFSIHVIFLSLWCP